MHPLFKGFDPFKWSEGQMKDKFDPFHWLENHIGSQTMPSANSGFFEQHVKDIMDQTLSFQRGQTGGGSGLRAPSASEAITHDQFDLLEYVVVKIKLPAHLDLSAISLYQGQNRIVVYNRFDQSESIIPLSVPVNSSVVNARYDHPFIEVSLPKESRQEHLREIHITTDHLP